MTNEDKFKEVFNIPSDYSMASTDICDMVDCGAFFKCDSCSLDVEDFWQREYKEKS